jgi:hypothetical protein
LASEAHIQATFLASGRILISRSLGMDLGSASPRQPARPCSCLHKAKAYDFPKVIDEAPLNDCAAGTIEPTMLALQFEAFA